MNIFDIVKDVPLLAKAALKVVHVELTETVPTAGVSFSPETFKPLKLQINPQFLNGLTESQKIGLISHELMHVVLNHAERAKPYLDQGYTPKQVNQAQDVSINEFLLAEGYDIPDGGCTVQSCDWLDNNMPTNLSFEKYLEQESDKSGDGEGQGEFDDNDEVAKWSGDFTELVKKAVQEDWSNDDQSKIKSQIGTLDDSKLLDFVPIIKPNKRWISLTKRMKASIDGEKDGESWKKNPYALQRILPSSTRLPSIQPNQTLKNVKRQVHVFMDFSGSCEDHCQTFLNAALSFPASHFETTLWTFSRSVHRYIDHNSVTASGGTCFKCVEQKLLSLSTYPNHVFVLTDGEGNTHNAKYPERWTWFETPSFDSTYCDSRSKRYKLSDFVAI